MVILCIFVTAGHLVNFRSCQAVSADHSLRVNSMLTLGKFVHFKTKIFFGHLQTNIEYSQKCFIVTFSRNSMKISDCRAYRQLWTLIDTGLGLCLVVGCRAYRHSVANSYVRRIYTISHFPMVFLNTLVRVTLNLDSKICFILKIMI